MNRREKMLLIGFIGVIVLWQGSSLVDSLFLQPITIRQDRIAALEKTISDKKIKDRELDLAQLKLKKWSARSLPPDPVIASALYQNWLIELATKSKFSNVTVTPNRSDAKPKGDTYFLISALIKAQGTLDHLCDFLYEFHNAGLLQRVTRMSVAAGKHDKNPELEITLTVEGLSLTNSPKRTTLFAPTLPSVAEKPKKSRGDYASITNRNPFVRGYNGPPPPKPSTAPVESKPKPAPVADAFDAAEFVYLIAVISSGKQLEIWLYDRSSNKRTTLVEGDEFDVAGTKGRVLLIGEDYASLLIDGSVWQLDVGDNLRQMRKMPSTGKVTVR